MYTADVHRYRCTQIQMYTDTYVLRYRCTHIQMYTAAVHRYRCTQIQMYTYTDVHRYRCTQIHMYTDTDVLRYIRTQIQMYTDTDVHRYRCTQIHMYTYTDVHIYRCTRIQMYTDTDVHIYICTQIQMYTDTDVHIYRCTQQQEVWKPKSWKKTGMDWKHETFKDGGLEVVRNIARLWQRPDWGYGCAASSLNAAVSAKQIYQPVTSSLQSVFLSPTFPNGVSTEHERIYIFQSHIRLNYSHRPIRLSHRQRHLSFRHVVPGISCAAWRKEKTRINKHEETIAFTRLQQIT